MLWRVTLLGLKNSLHSYDVDTGNCPPLTATQQMRERNAAVKLARREHLAKTGRKGIYSDIAPLGSAESWTQDHGDEAP